MHAAKGKLFCFGKQGHESIWVKKTLPPNFALKENPVAVSQNDFWK